MLSLKRAGLIFTVSFSFPLWALSGSIIDPSLSGGEERTDAAVSLKLKIFRNLRRPDEGFLNINKKNNIFDTLSVSMDLTASAPVKRFSYFETPDFLSNKSFLAVASYSSPVFYNSPKAKKDHCWQSVFCIKNLSVGVFSSLFHGGNFQGTSFVYFNLPVSKFKIQKQSFFLGVGFSLSTEYKLFSLSGFQAYALTSHFFDLDGYVYKTDKIQGDYNKPLSMAHQLGLWFKNTLSPFMPLVYVYGEHGSSVHFTGVFRQQANVNLSALWPVGKKLRLSAGLRWGDEIFSPNVKAVRKRKFFADDAYFTFGVNYLF